MEDKTIYTKVREGAHTQIFEPVRQCVYINAEDKLILSYVLGWQNDKGKDRQECSESNPKLIKHIGITQSVLERRIQVLNTTRFFHSKRVQREYADGMMAWGKVMKVNEAALLEFIKSPYDYNKMFNKNLKDRKKVSQVKPSEKQPEKVERMEFASQEPKKNVLEDIYAEFDFSTVPTVRKDVEPSSIYINSKGQALEVPVTQSETAGEAQTVVWTKERVYDMRRELHQEILAGGSAKNLLPLEIGDKITEMYRKRVRSTVSDNDHFDVVMMSMSDYYIEHIKHKKVVL